MESKLLINSIDNGTTIDHLPAGKALDVLKLLALDGKASIAIAINAPSTKMKIKDLIFIENFELNESEIKKIGLMAKEATINIVKNKAIAKKEKIGLPEFAEGIIKCINPKCITNQELLATKFKIQKEPLKATCHYCEHSMNKKEIIRAIK